MKAYKPIAVCWLLDTEQTETWPFGEEPIKFVKTEEDQQECHLFMIEQLTLGQDGLNARTTAGARLLASQYFQFQVALVLSVNEY